MIAASMLFAFSILPGLNFLTLPISTMRRLLKAYPPPVDLSYTCCAARKVRLMAFRGLSISTAELYRVLNWISCSMLSNWPRVGLSTSPLTPMPETVLVCILTSGSVDAAATPIIFVPSR